MMAFETNPALAADSRVRSIGRLNDHVSTLEVVTLVLLGVTAAVMSGYVRLGLRIPGHSIVLAVLPMAFGIAVVPRQLAGTTMSVSAMLTAALLSASGVRYFGVGAMASITAVGPLLDLALARARGGWRLYLGFVLAGLAANTVAFSVRGASKLLQVEGLGRRLFSDWLSQAAVTYVLAGALAGLLSAACWFRMRRTP
jgi:hypothetical protein